MPIRSMKELFNEPRLKDADEREQRFQQIVDDKAKELWEKLTDEVYAQQFVKGFIPYPETDLLANIIARIAEMQKEFSVRPATPEANAIYTAACRRVARSLLDDITEHVERVAEMNAESIFYPE